MDLKSPNILLGKDLTAKIADVGLARSVTNSSLTQMTSIGTMAWAAPELKRNFKIGRKEGPRSVSAKADVFRCSFCLSDPSPTLESNVCSVLPYSTSCSIVASYLKSRDGFLKTW